VADRLTETRAFIDFCKKAGVLPLKRILSNEDLTEDVCEYAIRFYGLAVRNCITIVPCAVFTLDQPFNFFSPARHTLPPFTRSQASSSHYVVGSARENTKSA
jgi:hypothetical protein